MLVEENQVVGGARALFHVPPHGIENCPRAEPGRLEGCRKWQSLSAEEEGRIRKQEVSGGGEGRAREQTPLHIWKLIARRTSYTRKEQVNVEHVTPVRDV